VGHAPGQRAAFELPNIVPVRRDADAAACVFALEPQERLGEILG
jgi:hypothetical protein